MQGSMRDLYQKVILAHNRNPRHFQEIPHATHSAQGHNPLCGDKVELFLVIEDQVVQEVGFQGAGCAISTASASLLTEAILGKKVEEAKALFEQMQQMLTLAKEHEESFEVLGDLAVFEGMRAYPARVKCVTLSWFALQAALACHETAISTE